MCQGREWPFPTRPLLPCPRPAHSDRTGGGRRPLRGAPSTLSGDPRTLGGAPRTPYTMTPAWRVVEPAAERSHLTQPPVPPPVPHPGWGGAARTCGSSPRRPSFVIQAVRPARSAEGPRTAPSAPPPTPAGAKGLEALGGLLCRGGEATGRFVPAPNGGLYPRHRAQTPVGGYHTTTHCRTTAARRR